MKITEYADALGFEIDIKYYPNQGNRWSAQFANCETKDSKESSTICGTYGDGKTPDEAIRNYVDRIRGKYLVFHALNPSRRREFEFPDSVK